MPRVVIRARRWAALLAITGLLSLPVTMWAHARSMAGMPCSTAAMPGHDGHGSVPAPDPSPGSDDCCNLCFVCAPFVALPAVPPPAAPVVGLLEVPTRTVEPARRYPTQSPHLLPFALGPPVLLG